MNFVKNILFLTNGKSNSYNLILVLFAQIIKIVYWKQVWILINRTKLTNVIITMIVKYNYFFRSIISNKSFFLS